MKTKLLPVPATALLLVAAMLTPELGRLELMVGVHHPCGCRQAVEISQLHVLLCGKEKQSAPNFCLRELLKEDWSS